MPRRNLERLASAFAPGGPFTGTRMRNQTAASSARQTQKAVTSLASSRGISNEEAKKELVKTAGQIKKTRKTLSELRGQSGRKVSVKKKELAARARITVSLAEHVLRTTPKRR